MDFRKDGGKVEDKISTTSLNAISKMGWIASAAFDLLFLANVTWPLLLLPGFTVGDQTVVDFWQLYFLTLPHRWITLLLVFLDADRRDKNSFVLGSSALLAAATVVGVYYGSGAFLCLGLVDYVWNSWHFASQHSGVLRIYSKKVRGGSQWLERWGVRFFVTYVILRAAGTLIWGEFFETSYGQLIIQADWAVLMLPLILIAANLKSFSVTRLPKLIYLLSFSSLYSIYLIASRFQWASVVVAMATAAALFHSVEYLAIVSHYARSRATIGSAGMMRSIATRWLLLLVVYLLTLGCLGWYFSTLSGSVLIWWQGANLWAALTHYAFDGVIWKLRRPETAKALGVA